MKFGAFTEVRDGISVLHLAVKSKASNRKQGHTRVVGFPAHSRMLA
jgi:hypothetical protein